MKIALKALLFCSALWSTAAFSASKELKVGDIWAYKNRPGEDGSTLTILKIENYPKLGKVIHIRVDGFQMINPVTGSEFNEMPHTYPSRQKPWNAASPTGWGKLQRLRISVRVIWHGERPLMRGRPGLSRLLFDKSSTD